MSETATTGEAAATAPPAPPPAHRLPTSRQPASRPPEPPVDTEPALPPAAQAPFVVKLVLMAWVLGYMLFTLRLLLDSWLGQHAQLVAFLELPVGTLLPPLFHDALIVVLGSVLGCAVLDVVSFHKYVAIKRDFQTPHVWGYFFAPFLAGVLGLIVFALLKSGLLVFTGQAQSADAAAEGVAGGLSIPDLGHLAIGFLAGFGWYEVTERVRRLVKRFFRDGDGDRGDRRGITERLAQAPVTGSEMDAAAEAEAAASVDADAALEEPSAPAAPRRAARRGHHRTED